MRANLRLIAATLVSVSIACGGSGGGAGGGGGGGGSTPELCSTTECWQRNLVVRAGGVPLPLTTASAATLDAARAPPTSRGPFQVWTTDGARIWGFDGAHWFVDAGEPLATGVVSIFGSGAPDVWAVGIGGKILHRDPLGWSAVASPTVAPLHDVWASGPADAWAVGESGTILHWDGGSWTAHAPAAGTTGWLDALWGSGPGDVFVGAPNGRILHWNGAAWSESSVGPSGAEHSSGWSVGPGAAWSVGPNGTCYVLSGSAWSACPAGLTSSTFESVWASGPSDAWIAADIAASIVRLHHWNGAAWSRVDPQTEPYGYAHYQDLWGSGPGDVWAVGDSVAGDAFRFDGARWRALPVPGDPALSSVWGPGPTLVTPVEPDFPVLKGFPPVAPVIGPPAADVPLHLPWTDPNQCRPALCFQVCDWQQVTCAPEYRCVPASPVGAFEGVLDLVLAFAAESATPEQSLVVKVRAASSPGCGGLSQIGDSTPLNVLVVPPPCPADVPACNAGGTCRVNRTSHPCAVPYVCTLSGSLSCPGDFHCPNGADTCGFDTTCEAPSTGCATPSSYGNYCCRPRTAGGTGFDGSYSATFVRVTPGGTTNGTGTFSCSGGTCTDPTNALVGTVAADGRFTGTFRVCDACSTFPVTGIFSTSTTFVLSGSSGGGSSVTITARKQ